MIVLPWPDKRLSPNSRIHWAAKAPVTKAARTQAYWQAHMAGVEVTGDGPIPMRVTFHAPDKRHRDRTNVEASCKAYFDGIADCLEVNDRRFEPTYAWGDPVKGGCVTVAIVS